MSSFTGNYGTAVGQSALQAGGANATAMGYQALQSNTGSNNVAMGYQALQANTTGANNVAIGPNTVSGNFSGSVILGRAATATASNQFVVGSTTYNAGTVTTETPATADRTWLVRINGANYKIPMVLIP